MEFSRSHLNKSPTQKMMYQIKKNLNVNPFTKKVNTKLSKQTIDFLNKTLNNKSTAQTVQKMSDDEIDKLKRELGKFDIPSKSVDEQLSDLTRVKDDLGCMAFDFGAGEPTYKNELVLFLAKSKSGKSYTTNNLIIELPQSFSAVTVFTGTQSYNNIATQTLKKMCEAANIDFFWFNTNDVKQPVDFCKEGTNIEDYKKDINEDGSVKTVWKNDFGSVFVFDDLQNVPTDSPIFHFINDMAIFSRHYKINVFINYQSFTRISSKILDNMTKVFICHDYLSRLDMFPKLRIEEPPNLQECINDPNPARFYYIDDDGLLVPYYNYQYSSKQQIINKLKAKTPVGLTKRKEAYQEKKKRLDELKKKEEEEKKKIEEDKRKYQERDEKDTPKEQKRIVANYSDPVGSGLKPTNNPIAKSNNNPKYTNPLRVSHFQRI